MKRVCLSLIILVTFISACRELPKPAVPVVSGDFEKGESFLYKRNDSAFYYFNKVATGSKDSLEIAMSYSGMATVQSDAGDYFGSQESLLASLKQLDERKEEDHFCLSGDYNELGNTSLKLKNYAAAASWFDLALKFLADDAFRIIVLNNKAVALQKNGEFPRAIAIYDSILQQQPTDKKEYARIKSNLARARWQQDAAYKAAPDLLEALRLRMDEKDNWGLNASYAHLSDYYSPHHPDSALIYAKKMYAIAQELNSPDDELEAMQKLIKLSPPDDSKRYFALYQTLSDSVQVARNAAKNQFAVVRYGAEKSKADNLRLQKENTEKKLQITQHRNGLYIMGIFFIAVIAIGFILYRKRRHRLKWESDTAIRESELKTSQKVHDVVANGLYRIMTDIEHGDNIQKEQLLDKIEALYEHSRDISYEHSGISSNDAPEAIANLLMSFGTPDTKVVILGNHADFWSPIKDGIRKELELILQELMINMKKHSKAGNVVLRFERQGDKLNIHYTDDGIGFPLMHQAGNGLNNTGNRINAMNGRIIFDSDLTKGLKIQIHIPLV